MSCINRRASGDSSIAGRRSAAALSALALSGVVGLVGLGSPAQASFPGVNGKIICSGALATELPTPLPPEYSRLELFSINPDGSGETRLMTNTASDFSPRYSADGSKVAWVKQDPNNAPAQVWTMNADGSNQTGPLTSLGSNSFMGDWSPDGTQLVFQSSRDGNQEIYKMNADGSNQVNLTNHTTFDAMPSWSPDGTRIAFRSSRAGNPDIWLMNADGTNLVNITADSPAEESGPRWSPDGTKIAFHSDRDKFPVPPPPNAARNLEIYRMNADGSSVKRLTFNEFSGGGGTAVPAFDLTGYDLFPAWSPDGTRIVFHSGRAQEFRDTGQTGIIAQWEAYHVDAVNGEGPGGSAPLRLTTRPGNDERCDWQPLRPASAPPPPPPAPQYPLPPGTAPLTAKLALARATINRRQRVLDVLAPITSLASGRVNVELHAAGQRYRFTAAINSRDGRIRFRQRIPAAQARKGTGILTIRYNGDDDTRPQTVRLRAANRRADLTASRPTLENNGRVRASGRISSRARGVVRIQLEYFADGKTTTLGLRARITNGRWSLNERLSDAVRAAIGRRVGTVHSYILFTGYEAARMRGEMRSLQVLGNR